MFRGDLIIDGYNVLYAADFGPFQGVGRLERAREDLLRRISDKLTSREQNRTTVVFDAPVQILGPSPPREVHGLLVMFADQDGDADAAIERLIRQNSAPRRLCVVSSDHRLQKAARRRRAKFLDSDVFLKRIAHRSLGTARDKEQEPAAKRSGRLPASEVEAWLQVFEDVEDTRFPSEEQPPDERSAKRTDVRSTSNSAPQHRSPRKENRRNSRRTPDEKGVDPLDEIAFWESRIAQLGDEETQRRD